jgi:hypothetical protein
MLLLQYLFHIKILKSLQFGKLLLAHRGKLLPVSVLYNKESVGIHVKILKSRPSRILLLAHRGKVLLFGFFYRQRGILLMSEVMCCVVNGNLWACFDLIFLFIAYNHDTKSLHGRFFGSSLVVIL